MNLDYYHLEARSAFHFGTRGVGLEASLDHAASDRLFSAFCHAVRQVESSAALTDLLAAFSSGRPPFLCSGAFPYVPLGDAFLRFYPAPILLRRAADRHVRKAAWLSETLFLAWLAGDTAALTTAVYLPSVRALVQDEEHLALMQHYRGNTRLWTIQEDVTRVAVDRITSAGNVYRTGLLRLVAGGGLWCAFADFSGQHQRILHLLTLLGDDGIGGERSSGYGQFRLAAMETRTLPDVVAGQPFVTLAHYSPQPDELAALTGEAAYDLIVSRGWIGSPEQGGLRRPAVRLVATGSVLQALADRTIYGRLVPVTPEPTEEAPVIRHPVYRYGYALPIGAGAG